MIFQTERSVVINKIKFRRTHMAYETLIYKTERSVGYITLNRPDRLNAICYQLIQDLLNVLDIIGEDESVRSVILTGAGRGFCAGYDIKELANPNSKQASREQSQYFFSRIENLSKPVIAAINGPCNGGGLEIALCCDFRLVSESASLGLGEVKLGVMPAGGGTVRLPRLIGTGRAKELMFFGEIIDAQEACRIGLVNKVVSPENLIQEAEKWAMTLAERPPLSVKMIKSCINLGMDMDLRCAIDYETKCSLILMNSEDSREGARAFVEKRKPIFKGH
jgi:enoyl-CoA hydratase